MQWEGVGQGRKALGCRASWGEKSFRKEDGLKVPSGAVHHPVSPRGTGKKEERLPCSFSWPRKSSHQAVSDQAEPCSQLGSQDLQPPWGAEGHQKASRSSQHHEERMGWAQSCLAPSGRDCGLLTGQGRGPRSWGSTSTQVP